jgi:Peptidase_C39 like family
VAYYTKDGIAIAIIHEGQRRGISPKGIQITLSCGLVESNLTMYANEADAESLGFPYDAMGYDHNSVGVFQQRAEWWGTCQQRMDAAASASMFYDGLNAYDYNSDEHSPGWYAQQVQQSAYPDRYDERFPDAVELYEHLAWMECPHQPGECRVTGPPGPLVSKTWMPETTAFGELVLDYDHDIVPQETGYWCGPASTQVVLNHQGIYVSEQQLANEMGTHGGGTDYIGQIETVLDNRVPHMSYITVNQPYDPMSHEDKERLWANLIRSMADEPRGGVVMNWVAPPGNYPIGIKGSQSPSYGGGTIYHYVACMGLDDNPNQRACWIADSGFYPFGYWCAFEQVSTLIPPKGYCYAAVEPTNEGGDDLTPEEHDKLMQLWGAFFNPVSSTSQYAPPDEGPIHPTKDLLRYTDGNLHGLFTEHRAILGDPYHINLVKAAADRGDSWAQHVYDLVPDEYKTAAAGLAAKSPPRAAPPRVEHRT